MSPLRLPKFAPSRRLAPVFLGLGWVALTVMLYLPVGMVMDISLDASNYASYSYFTARGFQYGAEVVPMVGPYGFITYGHTYGGELFWVRTALELAVKGLLAALLLWFWRQGGKDARGLRWLWVGAVVVFSLTIEDFPVEWLTVLAGLRLLHPTSPPGHAVRAALGVLFGLLALIKGTQLSLAVATVGLVSAFEIFGRRDLRAALVLAGSFAAGLLGWWLAAGQHPAHLPGFIQGVLQLTSGYNNAMGLDEPADIFHRGLLTAALLAAALLAAAGRCRRNPAALAGLALLAGYSFIKWKHGFVRADGHVFIFFQFASIAAVMWYFWVRVAAPESFAGGRVRVAGAAAVAAIFLASLNGAGADRWARLAWLLERVPISARERASQLLDLPGAKANLDRQLERQREVFSLPRLRERIGDARVDLYGFEHGIIPLNGLRYAPRPMGGGSFNVYTRHLMELNRSFMQDAARRPEFFLFKLHTIDNRLATQDDSQTLLSLLQNYHLEDVELGFVLLRRNDTPRPLNPVPLERRRIRFGETVKVPDAPPGQLVLAAFDVSPSWRGRLRSFLYKPSLVFINLEGRGLADAESRRLVPAMAGLPFPLNPALEDTTDFIRLFSSDPGKPVYSFRLAADSPADFVDELHVTFFTLPRPEPTASVDVQEAINFIRYPLTNTLPESITPPDARRMSLGNLPVQLLLPPAQMTWKLDGTEREFLFDYGFDPYSYERGNGNGASFFVELHHPDTSPMVVFHRHLDPVRQSVDRGNFSARLVLPPFRNGSRLVLRTDPGEHGDNAWDWTYVTRIQIKRGAYSEKQFPHFNRLPDTADVTYSMIIDDDDGRKLLILHAPGSVTFRLRGEERSLAFNYGFRPGAYSGGGQTDGAGYTVELLRPNSPPEILFHRLLRPSDANPQDQGRHRVVIPLPPLGPADRLTLRIDPGPDRNNAWDWTYVTDLELR